MNTKKSKVLTSKPRIKHKNPSERTKLRDLKEKLMKEGLEDEQIESWAGRIKTEE